MDSNEIRGMIESGEFLQHYGRKGMKWYQRIFTKYKDSKEKKAEKKQARKELTKDEIRSSRNAKLIAKNLGKFSDKEVSEILFRLRTDHEIKKIASSTSSKGEGVLKSVLKYGFYLSEMYDLITTTNLGTGLVKKMGAEDILKDYGKKRFTMSNLGGGKSKKKK